MDSLFTLSKSDEDKEIKRKLLSDYRTTFTEKELLSSVGGITNVIVKATDPLHVTAYQLFRSDLLKFVAEISEDVFVGADGKLKDEANGGISLKDFLNNLIGDAKNDHPFKKDKEDPHKKSIWFDLAYGETPPRALRNEIITNVNEIQLVITAVKNGKHPDDDNTGVICATTARGSIGGRPTEPPFSTPVHPMN